MNLWISGEWNGVFETAGMNAEYLMSPDIKSLNGFSKCRDNTATLISLLIGIPVGVLNAHSRLLYLITRPILDFMQTIPPFVILFQH